MDGHIRADQGKADHHAEIGGDIGDGPVSGHREGHICQQAGLAGQVNSRAQNVQQNGAGAEGDDCRQSHQTQGYRGRSHRQAGSKGDDRACSGRPFGARFALGALLTGGAGRALDALGADGALDTLGAEGALDALGALRAVSAVSTVSAGGAGRALDALGADGALDTLGAGRARDALGALRAVSAGGPWMP